MMQEDFDEMVEVMPALMTLEALLSGGVNALPRGVRRALESDDYSAALSAANVHYSQKGPDDRDASLVYAILLVGRQLSDEALGVLRRALTHHAQDVALQLAQCEALVVKGEFEAAVALLDGLKAVSTAKPRHWSFIGDMYLDMDLEQDAIDCYREAIDRGLESVDVSYRLGHLFLERTDLDGAAHYFGIAARLGKNNAMLWQLAAETYYDVGRIEDAIEAFEQMLEEQPYDERGWLYLGFSYLHFDRLPEAVDAFEKVVDLNPRHRIAWGQMGHILLAMGRGEEALQAFRETLRLKEDDMEALNGAVMAAYETGDIEAAQTWAYRATELAPENEESRYNLGVILVTLRRGEEAAEVLTPLLESEEADEEQRAKYLGALAVARIMNGQQEAGFEHIEEAGRLRVEPQWIAAFAEEVLKLQGAEEAMDFMDTIEVASPTWTVVRAMLGYLCSGLVENQERANSYATAFDEAIRKEPQEVPVMWDFESWEAFAFRLERSFEKVFDTMLAIVEGRQEIEDMKAFIEE